MYRFAHQRLKVYFMFNFSLLASRAKAQHHANESLSYRRFGLIKSFILSCDLIFTEDNQLKEKLFACKSHNNCADEDKHIQAGSETSSFVIKNSKTFHSVFGVFMARRQNLLRLKDETLISIKTFLFSRETESEKLKLETNKNFLHHAGESINFHHCQPHFPHFCRVTLNAFSKVVAGNV